MIYFITTNKQKFKYLSTFFKNDFEISQLNEDTIEIQAVNNKLIAEYSAMWAANKFNFPVIKEDVGMYINALNGFPGPYLSYIEKHIRSEGFLELLRKSNNRKAYWEYAVAYCEPRSNPKCFITRQYGEISIEARGNTGYYVDKIFIPDGENKTIAELLDNNTYRRGTEHYKKLKIYLRNNNK